MSRAISLAKTFMAGVRVAGAPNYIPAHIDATGKTVNARCIITVYENSNKGTNQDGSPGRTDQYTVIAWGKLADVCAVSCSAGKALDIIARPGSYIGTVYNPDGSPVLNMQGQPVQTRKTSFTVENIIFGEDSGKTIATEIANNLRPVNWQNQQHPDYQLWINCMRQRQATKYQPGMTSFGFARVSPPRNGQIINPAVQGQGNAGGFNQNANAGGGFNNAGGFAQPQNTGGFQRPANTGRGGYRNFNQPVNNAGAGGFTQPANTGGGFNNAGGFNQGGFTQPMNNNAGGPAPLF